MPGTDRVTLVDGCDRTIGAQEKLQAHLEGNLHRAFSIFVFNSEGLLLLQRRALSKYHSGGLWTNTCCGHPRPEESVEAAARRRLLEEMGFELDLIRVFTFTYTARLANGLIENEIDHVFFGTFDQNPAPEPDEVADWQWLGEDQVRHQIGDDPERFTYWFKAALKNCKWPKVLETYVQERT